MICAGLACAALAAACSAEPKVWSTTSALDFCRTFSGISADKAGQCWNMAPAVVAQSSSAEEYCGTVQAEVDAGRVVYDAAKGASCARTLATLAPCAFSISSGQQFPEDCADALTGTVTLGGQCFRSMDCTGGYCNAPLVCGGPDVLGQCVAFATEGQQCGGLCADALCLTCAPGLGCSFTATTPVCVALSFSGEGGACPCQAGLYCDTSSATPICKALKTSGSCTTPFASECAPGYVCFGAPASCVPYVGLGTRCGATALCGTGYYCDPVSEVCAAQPTVGQTCVISRSGTTAQLWCIGAWCDAAGTKTCQPRKADGELCTSYDQCVGSCDNLTQTCRARPPLGCATPF